MRRLGYVGLVGLLALAAGPGCDEWDKYWDQGSESPLGPPPDVVPPTVSVRTPSGADSLNASPVSGSTFSIEVAASDDQDLREVDLYVDGQLKALLSEPPFEYTWDTTPLEEGSVHSVWARAVDTSDNEAMSDTVFAVVFNAGPQVTLSTPGNGSLVTGEIDIEAEPVDPRVPVLRVDFLVDGMPVASASSSPFRVAWSSDVVEPGDHFLSAMAFGENNQIGISPFVRVHVNNSPPRVAVTFPETGRRVARLGTVPFSAVAVDTVHGAIGDSLRWTSDLDGEIGRGAYFRYQGLGVGVHTITATARNAWGLTGADQMQVIVQPDATYSFCWDLYFPFMINTCYPCHTPNDARYLDSEFDMTSYRTMMSGGRSLRELGLESVVPCKPESSLVWIKVSDDTPVVGDPMPPPGDLEPLSPEQLERIRTWIEEGAPPDGGLEDGC